ncbi:hypothetical protein [Xanthomonas sacchari]|uniref:hypothetical protein n=1 Tax=Xanthomonas sacchari TaxID=56458 RepID=UPI0027D7B5B1|nr:hypothetical protein [Xanthomonas sacchari]
MDELARLTSENCIARGLQIGEQTQAASHSLLLWIGYLRGIDNKNSANCLLDGALSATKEVLACLALGLVRPAVNSMRLQIDLVMGWLFFRDHPVEWARVQLKGDGYKLKSELLKYLVEHVDGFSRRLGILDAQMTRSERDVYRLLSAHVHGQSENTMPTVLRLTDIVGADKLQDEAIKLQAECCEYIGDMLWAVFADKWMSIPNPLQTLLASRFKTTAQRAEFFSL